MNSIEEIINDITQGKMVIIMDDEDRENEGDLLMAASWVRPEDINFMARYGRGLICLTMTESRCEQLRLPLMVGDTRDQHHTNFTVSIEAAEGVTTGISAADRAQTVRAAVARDAKPSDLVQPGHIFPIMAQPGGVLTRAGHTEAGCDLTALAGLEAASVIVEILNEDGTMARRPELEQFAQTHQLKIGTIADLIRYRASHEKTIHSVAECDVNTEWGPFKLLAFEESHRKLVHLVMVKGELNADVPALVRVHMQDHLADMAGFEWAAMGWPYRRALARIAEEGSGVLVILSHMMEPQDIIQRINQFTLKEKGVTLPQPSPSDDMRTYGVGAQILTAMGLRKLRVLGTPKRFHGLAGFGLKIIEYVDCD
ncbi:MAG: 3,4-dihydroxy-2-butanone-4-phosphate synthase [Gammaproteobacteria bacterium]|nr:3,4-dihydroxy-2-butanone-4-phosphate synthase [Gammaproteobacteria bacterium]